MSAFLQRRRREPMGVKEPGMIRSAAHLAFVRGFVCAITDKAGHVCGGKVEAAHARAGTDGGTGLKPSDCWALPLCHDAHAEQHQLGEPAFEARYGIDMKAIARRLWSISKAAKKLVRV